jgi:ABC-2 type transport system ATP-binding protein
MNELVIETTNLQKVYGKKTAVADLSLQVPRGEVFGFLGPNGAGKSTSVKMLLGLVAPTGGHATLLGQPAGHTATMARVGFLPEHFRFPEWLQATELLDLYGKLANMDATNRRQRIPELLELVGLTEHARRPIAGFSKGMLQRIGLAQALLNKPELVFLDEPTSALDPFGRMLVRKIIHRLKDEGTTVFLNSHLLGEVEATCDRVSFIKEGRVIRTIALDDFREEQVVVEVRVDAVTPALLAEMEKITEMPLNNTPASTNGSPQTKEPLAALHVTVKNEEMLPLIAERTLASGARLYALIPQKTSLEEIFLTIVGTEDSGQ